MMLMRPGGMSVWTKRPRRMEHILCFYGWHSIVLDHERQRSGRRLTLTGLWRNSTGVSLDSRNLAARTKASVIIELDVEIIEYCALPDLPQFQDDISLSTPLEGHQT